MAVFLLSINVRFFHLNFDWHGMIIAQLSFLRINSIYDKVWIFD